jgi:hypothetical protein
VAGVRDALLHVSSALERVERRKLLFRFVFTAALPVFRGLGLNVPALVELLPKEDALPHDLLLRIGLGLAWGRGLTWRSRLARLRLSGLGLLGRDGTGHGNGERESKNKANEN